MSFLDGLRLEGTLRIYLPLLLLLKFSDFTLFISQSSGYLLTDVLLLLF